MSWVGVITNGGNDLLRQWVSGGELSILSAAAGTGTVSESALMAQTALVTQKQVASIISHETVSGGQKIKLQITAPATAYTMNQFGIWAKLGSGTSTLLAIFQNADGISVPSSAQSPDFVYTFYGLLAFSNTGTLSVTIDTSALVTQSTMTAAINASAATKQNKITASGLLKADGNGNVSAAEAGNDYGFALLKGSGAPTTATVGSVGQHYFDTTGKHEYVCTTVSGTTYTWKLSGATNTDDISHDGQVLSAFLDGVSEDISELSETVDNSKPLTGSTDPTSSTEGAVGQMYLNTVTMQQFFCKSASGGIYTWEKPAGGGLKPQVSVSVATGATVTATDGTTTLTETSVSDSCVFNLPNYGTWTFQATRAGKTSGSVSVTVDQVKQYSITLSFFSATVVVTAESGASVSLTDGTHAYTGTCGSDGKCTLTVNYSGTYTASATLNGISSGTASVSVTSSGSTYTATVRFITLTVTIDSGSTVTVTNGSTTKSGTSTGSIKFYLPNTGTWSVTATLNGETTSGSIACSSYTGYSLELSYAKVFGVCWNYGSSSTALSRLTKANDPNGFVTVNITTEPSPAVGTGNGSSPFDSYAPWCDMDEYNIINNAVSYRKGSRNFSRSSYDTMVLVPEYYFKIVDDSANSKRYFYVADKAKTGFTKHPGSGKYIGRYNTISGYYSKTGAAPLVEITRATARTNSKAKGSKWSQYDFAAWCAVWLLYLVEFADWNSQTKIGRGVVDESAAVNSGGTDSMSYHTGRASGTDGQTAVQYRHIENPWGNVYELIDGINFTERAAYVCTTPDNYADDTSSNYTAAGVTLPKNGNILGLGVSSSFPWAFLPNANGGSETTYIPDYVYSYMGWRVLCVGGCCNDSSNAGLFMFNADYGSSVAGSIIGARLLYHP